MMYVVFEMDQTANTSLMEICPNAEAAKTEMLAFLNERSQACGREAIDEYHDGRLHGWDQYNPREAYAFPLEVLTTALSLLEEALNAVEADETARRKSWPDEKLTLNLGVRIRQLLDATIWRVS